MNEPPDGLRREMRVTKPVNLRTEPSQASSSNGLLAQEAIVWKDGESDVWIEVWVHGWIRSDFLKAID